MKTLIIYATTYGFTEKCVHMLKEKLDGEVDIINIKKRKISDISGYDKVIIGGSIYMAQIQKEIKAFSNSRLEELLKKEIGLFLCCGFADHFEAHLNFVFPAQLVEKAKAKECFGGEIIIEKLSFLHKLITKAVSKAGNKDSKLTAVLLFDNIDVLAKAMNA
jgi:menaquinone-dependent protoporphyrinogen oxidase